MGYQVKTPYASGIFCVCISYAVLGLGPLQIAGSKRERGAYFAATNLYRSPPAAYSMAMPRYSGVRKHSLKRTMWG